MSGLDNGGYVHLMRHNFLVSVHFDNKADLTALIAWAKENEFKPFDPTLVAITQIAEKMQPLDAQSTTPLCPVHKTPMRLSNNGKGYYCTKKTADGFCKERSK